MRTSSLYIKFILRSMAVTVITLSISCKKFVTVPPPETALVDETVFSKDQTATAALMDAYFNLSELNGSPNLSCLSKLNSAYTDEYVVVSSTPQWQALFQNALEADDVGVGQTWTEAYKAIYKSNVVMEGLQRYGGNLSRRVKDQLMGEAKFIRSTAYFVLLNMFGDVPLLRTADYEANRLAQRTETDQVYAQIIADLAEARTLTADDYLDPSNNPGALRVRVNKDVVTAMQAKVHLYQSAWEKAEEYATVLIEKTAVYGLEPDLSNVFGTASREAIWSFNDLGWYYPWIGLNYILDAPPSNADWPFGIGMLSDAMMNSFEAGDMRREKWVASISDGTTVFYYPHKYRAVDWNAPVVTQLLSAIRLAELYLIRAEARIQQNRIAEGIADLNVIRSRARAIPTATVPDPLPELSPTLSNTAAMQALEHERMVELFTEGHRFFDLKRWKGLQNPNLSRADELMPAIAAAKGVTWEGYKKLLPIPRNDINLNPNLKQNPEY